MISVVSAQSRVYTAALVFYICVWIPFLELKRSILKILGFFLFCFMKGHDDMKQLHLPVARVGDLKLPRAELCSICLVEFEKEDVVNRLPKCRHVFHMDCLQKWLRQDQFTCPLCRSLLFIPFKCC